MAFSPPLWLIGLNCVLKIELWKLACLLTMYRTIQKYIWCHSAPPHHGVKVPAKSPKIRKRRYFKYSEKIKNWVLWLQKLLKTWDWPKKQCKSVKTTFGAEIKSHQFFKKGGQKLLDMKFLNFRQIFSLWEDSGYEVVLLNSPQIGLQKLYWGFGNGSTEKKLSTIFKVAKNFWALLY